MSVGIGPNGETGDGYAGSLPGREESILALVGAVARVGDGNWLEVLREGRRGSRWSRERQNGGQGFFEQMNKVTGQYFRFSPPPLCTYSVRAGRPEGGVHPKILCQVSGGGLEPWTLAERLKTD